MAIWFKNYTLEDIKIPPTGIDEKLGIEIVEIGSDYIICKIWNNFFIILLKKITNNKTLIFI